ncbi:MAG: amidohydrolase family protein [Bacteroidales bacterium]|nr:amidohydrolase family protein [Bacteroidales bacterium]
MKTYKLQAGLIIPVHQKPIPNGIIHLDADGIILGLYDESEYCSETVWYDGIICPGFINAHTHLELSGMKTLIPEGSGLNAFIGHVEKLKQHHLTDESLMLAAMDDMWESGTVAACDISNTRASISVKNNREIYWHNFIEVFGSHPSVAQSQFDKGIELLKEFQSRLPQFKSSLSPHATYSLSTELFNLLKEYISNYPGPFSIHNSESEDEIALFTRNEGKIATRLREWGVPSDYLPFSAKRPLQSIYNLLPNLQRVLLVHNTLSNAADLDFIMQAFSDPWFCLCPESNQYISKQMPIVVLFRKFTDRICLGTDSYASSGSLSIARQIYLLMQQKNGPGLEEAIRWGSINGARFMNIEEKFGTLEPGKKPGIIQITGFDLQKEHWINEPMVKRIF